MNYVLAYPLWTALAAVNILTFLMMGLDKLLAKAHVRRIPERILMVLAAFFGSAGGLLGMFAFRHKTRHAKFRIGLPVLLIIHIAAVYFILTTDWTGKLPWM